MSATHSYMLKARPCPSGSSRTNLCGPGFTTQWTQTTFVCVTYISIHPFAFANILGLVQWKRLAANSTHTHAHARTHARTHTHTRLTALFPGLPRWAGTRKVIPIWILLKQETVSGSGTSWAICKSAPCSRQITMPAPHRSIFYRPDALPATQPTASKHWIAISD